MPYTYAFMEELFRFRPVGPIGLYHCSTEDTQLGKYAIPKGTLVIKLAFIIICINNRLLID